MNAVQGIGLSVIVALACVAAARHASAQDTYTTPLYSTAKPEPVDPNYGLPSFGMPNAELPRQRTMAPKPDAAAQAPDVFARAQRGPLAKAIGKGDDPSDTPLFTTDDGASAALAIRIRRGKPYLDSTKTNPDR
jgi:hypothetical protein